MHNMPLKFNVTKFLIVKNKNNCREYVSSVFIVHITDVSL